MNEKKCPHCNNFVKFIKKLNRIEKIDYGRIKSIYDVKCSHEFCKKLIKVKIETSQKYMPVNLFVGRYTNHSLKRWKNERKEVNRIIKNAFTKPQLRYYKLPDVQLKNEKWIPIHNCKYEVLENNKSNYNFIRKNVWHTMKNQHLQPIKEYKTKTVCQNHSMLNENGEIVDCAKTEYFTMTTLGLGKKQRARICVSGSQMMLGTHQVFDETSRQFIPSDEPMHYPYEELEATTDEIKYCGFGQCPNRYAYITRPDKLLEVFGK